MCSCYPASCALYPVSLCLAFCCQEVYTNPEMREHKRHLKSAMACPAKGAQIRASAVREAPAPGRLLRSQVQGVVVLYSAADTPAEAASGEVLADLETTAVADAVAQILRTHTELDVHVLPAAQRVAAKLGPYPPDRYVVFNLFEALDNLVGKDGTPLPDQEAPAAFALEALGYRFTGADGRALALALDKAETKKVLQRGGVPTPPWRVFTRADEVSAGALGALRFPLIVKPLAEDSSLAIDHKAVVTDLSGLEERVRYVLERYHQPVLVEAFIDGREISLAVWGSPPELLPLSEVDLSAFDDPTQRIVTFAAKWEQDSFDYAHTPVICPAVVPDDLAARIRDMALRAWELIAGCRGYGRVDTRLQGDQVYVIEVNPNPSIAEDSGFARSARAAGLDYAQMILKILSSVMEVPLVDRSAR